MAKFIISPSGGGLGAKKVALVDIGGDTYELGGIDLGVGYGIVGAFCDQYNCTVDGGKIVLFDGTGGEITGEIGAGTKVLLILGV